MAGDWNRNIIAEFHAKHGKGIGHFGDRLLLLTTKGAKSGAHTNPDWYHNLVQHKRATVEVGDEHFEVKATPIAKGRERDRLYEAHAALMPGFRDYSKKTKRVIPVVVLERVAPSTRA